MYHIPVADLTIEYLAVPGSRAREFQNCEQLGQLGKEQQLQEAELRNVEEVGRTRLAVRGWEGNKCRTN